MRKAKMLKQQDRYVKHTRAKKAELRAAKNQRHNEKRRKARVHLQPKTAVEVNS